MSFKLHAGGTLFSMPDSFPSLRMRVVDISPLNIPWHMEQMRMFGVTGLPALAMNVRQSNSAQYALAEYPPVRDELERLGLVFWTSLTSDFDMIFSNKPIRRVEDLRGLKIHASGDMALLVAQFGAAPVTIALGEIYEALQRGTIDAAMFPREPGIMRRFHEVVDYVVYGQFGCRGQGIFINARSWAALPQDIQAIFKEAGEEFVNLYVDYLERDPRVRDLQKILAEHRVTHITLSDECNQKLFDAAHTAVIRAWIGRREREDLPGQAVLDRYLDLLRQYRR